MKTTTLIVGDEHGLRGQSSGCLPVLPTPYRGPTGQAANPDAGFILEVRTRRNALKLSATGLGRETPLSNAYISMLENGTRFASNEAKQLIRQTLDRLEKERS